ncbi:hypothetical protein FOCC_FOCC013300, partial [Frankliniella occidentalis]
MILRQTCTEKLQTFHKPSKKCRGSPIKSDQMIKGDRESCIYDPRPAKYQNRIKHRMHNLVGSYHSTMLLKCLIPHANPYAIELEHQYAKESPTIAFLKSMNLFAVSQEKIDFIREKKQVNQDSLWSAFQERSLEGVANHATRETLKGDVYKVAMKFLPILATSVPAERLFSHAGQAAPQIRARHTVNVRSLVTDLLPAPPGCQPTTQRRPQGQKDGEGNSGDQVHPDG